MEKKKGLFNFLTLGITVSVVVLFMANILNFSLSIDLNLIGKILGLFLLIAFFINLESIKKFFLNLKNIKSFFMLSFLNLLLIFFFVLFYSIFRFGSPLIFEDRIANFKVSQKKEIVLGEPLRQSFTAKSNNLGTIGLKIIVEDKDLSATAFEKVFEEDEEIARQLSKGETDKIIFRIKEDKPKIRDLTENFQSSISLFGIPLQKKSQDEGYIFEKEKSLNYFYENTYELTADLQTGYFLFGFPIQKDSKDKSYIFEIKKVEEGEMGKTFLLEKNSDGQLNFYPKYNYTLREIKSDSLQIISNISRKINQFLEEKINQISLIFIFILIEILIISFLKKEEKYFKEKINPYLKYGFLIGLLLTVISSLNFEFIKNVNYLQNVIDNLSKYSFPLILLTIALGFLVFYFNKEEIEKDFEEEKEVEEDTEKKRYEEFDKKFPFFAWSNFGYGIGKVWKEGRYFLAIGQAIASPLVWFRRLPYSFVKWMYKEGWRYSIGLIVIVLIGSIFLFYHLGQLDFYEDEFITVSVANSFLNTGDFYKWDWIQNTSGKYTDCMNLDPYCHYNRAWPYTLTAALSYKLFGVSEFSTRLPGVLFGLLFIILVYFFTKYFTKNKFLSLISSILCILNIYFLNLFRYARMYSLLLPIYLILFFFIFVFLKRKFKNLSRFKNLLFVPGLILLIISYYLHINTLIILPVIFGYLLIKSALAQNARKIFIVLLSLLILSFLFLYIKWDSINQLISFFGVFNFKYLFYFAGQNLFLGTYIIVISLSLFIALFSKKDLFKSELLFLSLHVIFTLIFFIFIANRYTSFNYVSHIVIISFILFIFTIFILFRVYNKFLAKLFLILFVLLFLYNFSTNIGSIYDENLKPEYSNAYGILSNNLSAEDVVFGQYLKDYYLRKVNSNISIINMLFNKQYNYSSFLESIKKYENHDIWLVWDTAKTEHLQPEIVEYACNYFTHITGTICVDNNSTYKNSDYAGVEIFYLPK